MNPPLWALQLAEAFWDDVGEREPFPRTLRTAILRSSLDLTLEELPDLTTSRIEAYLAFRGCARCCGEADRPLRGCLLAEAGGGFIFLDASDDPAERTVSLAHELAHFLRHYLHLRSRARRILGDDVLAVLDGRRSASPSERLQALLHNVTIDCHVHLMGRNAELALREVDIAEAEADVLALELLAPAKEVVGRWGDHGCEASLVSILRETFGLPEAMAHEYARRFLPNASKDPLIARLKKAAEACRTSSAPRETCTGGSRDVRDA